MQVKCQHCDKSSVFHAKRVIENETTAVITHLCRTCYTERYILSDATHEVQIDCDNLIDYLVTGNKAILGHIVHHMGDDDLLPVLCLGSQIGTQSLLDQMKPDRSSRILRMMHEHGPFRMQEYERCLDTIEQLISDHVKRQR